MDQTETPDPDLRRAPGAYNETLVGPTAVASTDLDAEVLVSDDQSTEADLADLAVDWSETEQR